MMEKDLARPVISVRDLETAAIEYEIYKYGEETVVSPLRAAKERVPERFEKQGGRGRDVQPWKKGFDGGNGQFWKSKGKHRR